jgi:hypothetical protein
MLFSRRNWIVPAVLCTILHTAAADTAVDKDESPRSAPRGESYIDDDDQRALADLRFYLDPQRGDALQIAISAVGPQVEPIGGYRGIGGTNRYTAEELQLMLSGFHDVQIRTRTPDGRIRIGTISSQRSQRLPTRLFRPGQPIDFFAMTAREYPLEVIAHTSQSGPGAATTEVLLNGVPRLRVNYIIERGNVRLLGAESIGHDDQLLTDLRWIRPGQNGRPDIAQRHLFVAAQDNAELPATLISDWESRDIEGRWVRLRRDLEANPERIDLWVDYLHKRGEDELLEWLAIYIPDAFKSHNVGTLLANSDSPRWLRVAVWHQNAPVSIGHSRQVANEIVLYHAPAIAEDWLAKHRNDIDNWENRVSTFYDQLTGDKIPPADSSALLPPLQPVDVFKFLTPASNVIPFGDRLQAQPGDVYVHQVLRAISGVVVSGRSDKEFLAAVRQLTRHDNLQIRQSALMSFSWLAKRYDGMERFEDLVALVDNPAEPDLLREAALMGYSYHWHPAVLLKLHDVAREPSHPAWRAAVSRLGDIGQSFSVELLNRTDKSQLNAGDKQLLSDALNRIEARVAGEIQLSDVAARLRLATFAAEMKDPHTRMLREWAVAGGQKLDTKGRQDLQAWAPWVYGKFWTPASEEQFEKNYAELLEAAIKRND